MKIPEDCGYRAGEGTVRMKLVVRKLIGGSALRTHTVTGEGKLPRVGQPIVLFGEPLKAGFDGRLFQSSLVVRIDGAHFYTYSGSVYHVTEGEEQ